MPPVDGMIGPMTSEKDTTLPNFTQRLESLKAEEKLFTKKIRAFTRKTLTECGIDCLKPKTKKGSDEGNDLIVQIKKLKSGKWKYSLVFANGEITLYAYGKRKAGWTEMEKFEKYFPHLIKRDEGLLTR